jgi:hypothetical protein
MQLFNVKVSGTHSYQCVCIALKVGINLDTELFLSLSNSVTVQCFILLDAGTHSKRVWWSSLRMNQELLPDRGPWLAGNAHNNLPVQLINEKNHGLVCNNWNALSLCSHATSRYCVCPTSHRTDLIENRPHWETNKCVSCEVRTELCILPTQCICVFRMVLTINSNYLPKQH